MRTRFIRLFFEASKVFSVKLADAAQKLGLDSFLKSWKCSFEWVSRFNFVFLGDCIFDRLLFRVQVRFKILHNFFLSAPKLFFYYSFNNPYIYKDLFCMRSPLVSSSLLIKPGFDFLHILWDCFHVLFLETLKKIFLYFRDLRILEVLLGHRPLDQREFSINLTQF